MRRNLLILFALAACTVGASEIFAGEILSGAFPAPEFHLLVLCAGDAELAHFLVPADFRFREFAVFPENDVETQPENAESHEYDGSDE